MRLLLIDLCLVNTDQDQELGQPEQLPVVVSDNDSEASASAGEIDSSYGADRESLNTNPKLQANEKLFLRTTIYFKKEAPSQHQQLLMSHNNDKNGGKKKTKSFLKAAEYLCKSINGSI